MRLRDLELGAIQAHILYHATQQPIYGSWMAEELARHGLVVSLGKQISQIAGVALMVYGVIVILLPAALPTVVS